VPCMWYETLYGAISKEFSCVNSEVGVSDALLENLYEAIKTRRRNQSSFHPILYDIPSSCLVMAIAQQCTGEFHCVRKLTPPTLSIINQCFLFLSAIDHKVLYLFITKRCSPRLFSMLYTISNSCCKTEMITQIIDCCCCFVVLNECHRVALNIVV